MTAVGTTPVLASWTEPEGIRPRGTVVVVVPGRGEHAAVYERFGRRIAADGYRVWAVSDPTVDAARTLGQIRSLLDRTPSEEPGEAGPPPRVLVGSDTGALFAAGLVADGAAGIDGLVLAGLPLHTTPGAPDWADELALRTSCPTHRGRLDADDTVRRGALTGRLPDGWVDRARPAAIGVPVLGLHGAADAVSPLADVRDFYAALPDGELVGVAGGVHDALNDATHRIAAATAVLFLERLRVGSPLARVEVAAVPR